YVDGKEVGKKTIGDFKLFTDPNSSSLVLGCRPPNMDRTFNGVLDDVRMYDKALSAEDVRKLYVFKGGAADKAALPNPADKSENVLPNQKLKWTKGSNAKSSAVYFSTDEAAVKNAKIAVAKTGNENFDPGRLKFNTNYFWRVDSLANGKISKGDVWSFSTVAGKAENPSPDPLLKNIDTNTKLTWKASPLAKSHDVYFGDDLDKVANATKGSKLHKGTIALGKESLDPGKLKEGKFYYWRVDENCAAGVAKGDVWQFRTKGGGLVIQVDLAVKTCDNSKLYPGLAKPGWTIWASNAWTDMYMHDYQIFPLKEDGSGLDEAGINGTGVTLWFTTGNEGQLGIGAKGICRDNLGGGGCPSGTAQGDPIANSWAYGVDWVGPYAGDLLLLIRNLPAGTYQVNSYHNFWEPCTQSTRNCLNCDCGMPPMPAITARSLPEQLVSLDANGVRTEGGWTWKAHLPVGDGKGVEPILNAYNVAPQHVYKDSELVPSVIKFKTDGSDVLVIYEADRSEPLYPDCARKGREGARGILNAFEIIAIEN
ncbi:MAG: LamG-like jellyroll fold domain-containing protein, partial [Planctomycetota bacterium]